MHICTPLAPERRSAHHPFRSARRVPRKVHIEGGEAQIWANRVHIDAVFLPSCDWAMSMKLETFCTDDLEYKPIRKPQNGGSAKTVAVFVKDGGRIDIQLTEDIHKPHTIIYDLRAPMADPTKMLWNLEMSVDPKSPIFRVIQDLDRRNILEGTKHSEDWFGKSMQQEMIEEWYTPLLHKSKLDDSYFVKVKVNVGSQKPTKIWKCSFNEDGNVVYKVADHSIATRFSKCIARIDTPGLWVVNKSFGMSLYASSVMVFPSPSKTGDVSEFEFNDFTGKRILEEEESDPPPEPKVARIASPPYPYDDDKDGIFSE